MRDVDEILSEWEILPPDSPRAKKLNDEIDKAFIEEARDMYQEEGSIEIDDKAVVSLSDDFGIGITGAYVQAWVYVPRR